MSKYDVLRVVYENPNGLVTVKYFEGDYSDYNKVFSKLSEAFGINIECAIITKKYYNDDIENVMVAYIDIGDLVSRMMNGGSVCMDIFDIIAEEYAFNEKYEEFVVNKILNINNAEVAFKIINYITEKSIDLINKHMEIVTKRYHAYIDRTNRLKSVQDKDCDIRPSYHTEKLNEAIILEPEDYHNDEEWKTVLKIFALKEADRVVIDKGSIIEYFGVPKK